MYLLFTNLLIGTAIVLMRYAISDDGSKLLRVDAPTWMKCANLERKHKQMFSQPIHSHAFRVELTVAMVSATGRQIANSTSRHFSRLRRSTRLLVWNRFRLDTAELRMAWSSTRLCDTSTTTTLFGTHVQLTGVCRAAWVSEHHLRYIRPH